MNDLLTVNIMIHMETNHSDEAITERCNEFDFSAFVTL